MATILARSNVIIGIRYPPLELIQSRPWDPIPKKGLEDGAAKYSVERRFAIPRDHRAGVRTADLCCENGSGGKHLQLGGKNDERDPSKAKRLQRLKSGNERLR
jgi:hypothetical protein